MRLLKVGVVFSLSLFFLLVEGHVLIVPEARGIEGNALLEGRTDTCYEPARLFLPLGALTSLRGSFCMSTVVRRLWGYWEMTIG